MVTKFYQIHAYQLLFLSQNTHELAAYFIILKFLFYFTTLDRNVKVIDIPCV